MAGQQQGHTGAEGGGADNIAWEKFYDVTPSVSSIGTGAVLNVDVACPGVKLGDTVVFNGVAPTNGAFAAHARVQAADTVRITYVNPTAGSLTPATGAGRIYAVRKASGA